MSDLDSAVNELRARRERAEATEERRARARRILNSLYGYYAVTNQMLDDDVDILEPHLSAPAPATLPDKESK